MKFENGALIDAMKLLVAGVLPQEAEPIKVLDYADRSKDPLPILEAAFSQSSPEIGVDFYTILGIAIFAVRNKPRLFRTRVLEAREVLARLRERKYD